MLTSVRPASLSPSAGRAAVAAAVVVTLALPAAAQLKAPPVDTSGLPPKLSGEEIRQAWFDGRPFVSAGPDGTEYRMTFTPDGKASRLPLKAKKNARPVTGFWRVIAEGYCSRWSGTSREKCFNVRKSPDGSETLVRFGHQMAGSWKRP